MNQCIKLMDLSGLLHSARIQNFERLQSKAENVTSKNTHTTIIRLSFPVNNGKRAG